VTSCPEPSPPPCDEAGHPAGLVKFIPRSWVEGVLLLAPGTSDSARQTDALTRVPARTLSKHELQYTGLSFRGANGTTAWPPQAPQMAA
jgi:hypothetical protein